MVKETKCSEGGGGVEVLIEELRANLADVQNNPDWALKLSMDFYLFQWLKAKQMNVKKADKAIRKAFNWRSENGITNPIRDFPEDLTFRLPIFEDARSLNGAPVYLVQLKDWRIHSLIQTVGIEKLVRYFHLVMLKMENKWIQHNLTALNKNLIEFTSPQYFTIIIDDKDFPPHQRVSSDLRKQLTRKIDKYFPPIIQDVIVINASPFLYSMKGIVNPPTWLNLQIYNCDESKWKKQVSKLISLDQLPQGFGGLQ